MDISAPRANRPMPSTSMAAPSRKDSISPLSMGTSAKHSTATMAVMGSTEAMASRIFSLMTLRLYKALLLLNFLIYIIHDTGLWVNTAGR